MIDYLTACWTLFLSSNHPYWLMFASSFLSATLLPGNSEVVFSGLAGAYVLAEKTPLWLLLVATFGNSLGSITTLLIAYRLPKPKPEQLQRPSARWALMQSQRYGVWVLLLSWLPVVGDLFCALAGWLRFSLWQSIILITLGKAVRYALLLWGVYTFTY